MSMPPFLAHSLGVRSLHSTSLSSSASCGGQQRDVRGRGGGGGHGLGMQEPTPTLVPPSSRQASAVIFLHSSASPLSPATQQRTRFSGSARSGTMPFSTSRPPRE